MSGQFEHIGQTGAGEEEFREAGVGGRFVRYLEMRKTKNPASGEAGFSDL